MNVKKELYFIKVYSENLVSYPKFPDLPLGQKSTSCVSVHLEIVCVCVCVCVCESIYVCAYAIFIQTIACVLHICAFYNQILKIFSHTYLPNSF